MAITMNNCFKEESTKSYRLPTPCIYISQVLNAMHYIIRRKRPVSTAARIAWSPKSPLFPYLPGGA